MARKKHKKTDQKKRDAIFHPFREVRTIGPFVIGGVKNDDVPKVLNNTKDTFLFLKKHFRIFGKMFLLHFIVYIAFVRVAPQTSVAELQELFVQLFGSSQGIVSHTSLLSESFSIKVASFSSQNPAVLILLNIISTLAIIWAIRHSAAGKKFRLKDPYYKGMNQIIQFSVVMLIMMLQLIPFVIGASVYNLVDDAISLNSLESALLGGLWLAMGAISAFWIVVSGISMYAVTLNDVEPLEALRGVRDRLRGRRFYVIANILGFMAIVSFVLFLLLLAIIYLASGITLYIFDVIFVLMPFIFHTYLYKVYRSIL